MSGEPDPPKRQRRVTVRDGLAIFGLLLYAVFFLTIAIVLWRDQRGVKWLHDLLGPTFIGAVLLLVPVPGFLLVRCSPRIRDWTHLPPRRARRRR